MAWMHLIWNVDIFNILRRATKSEIPNNLDKPASDPHGQFCGTSEGKKSAVG